LFCTIPKKCKSHQCEKCQKYYANERTLQSHSCEEEPIKVAEDTTAQVDRGIKVIKLDKNKINHQPAKCFDCGNLIQCYGLLKSHQTVPNSCGACVQKFNTTCQLLRHTCAGIPEKSLNISSSNVPPSPAEKRIRIKTEPGLIPAIPQAPVVILKNVNDSNIPEIIDDESPTRSGSKKKLSK